MPTEEIRRIFPIPINDTVLAAALRLKKMGLPWWPHVGCFVWDHEAVIHAPSPFPKRVYFILSMRRFTDIFGSEEKMRQQLVWVPTWHQALSLCSQLGVAGIRADGSDPIRFPDSGGDGLVRLYDVIAAKLAAAMPGHPTGARKGGASESKRWIHKAMEADLGSLAQLPQALQERIQTVYHEAGMAYLGWRRIQDQQADAWVPAEATFDATLLDDLGHFYSDYQQVVKSIALIRKKIGRLQSIDPSKSPDAYEEIVKELMEMNDRGPLPGQVMAGLMDPG